MPVLHCAQLYNDQDITNLVQTCVFLRRYCKIFAYSLLRNEGFGKLSNRRLRRYIELCLVIVSAEKY